MATGRSDYPNQVNNVLCFPFIFRGALDVGASEINEAMKVAAVEAIAELARAEASEVVASAYGGVAPMFGAQYIIPKPFDPRLILQIAPAVARAAMDSGVATRPIADFDAYRQELELFVYRSGQLMRPVFERARKAKPSRRGASASPMPRAKTSACCAPSRPCSTRALTKPVLIGRRDVIAAKAAEMGLRLDFDSRVEILDPSADTALFAPLVERYQGLVSRRGVPPLAAERRVTNRRTVSASMLLQAGHVDAALVGGAGDWWQHMTYVLPIIPKRENVGRVYALSALILDNGTLFFCDTHVNVDPTAEQVAEMTLLAAESVRRFGLTPKAALLSHSSFGASNSPTARKMREALALVRERAPELEVDGEMHADAALSQALRDRLVHDSALKGSANLLVMPTLDAANIALTLLSAATEGLLVGPLLLGMSRPLHVLTPSVTARGIANVTALAVNQAAAEREHRLI
jgi:malate dehydrogenase (oxaloacetate-decarboxylating)(NADP+)